MIFPIFSFLFFSFLLFSRHTDFQLIPGYPRISISSYFYGGGKERKSLLTIIGIV